jgi:hypothetical protein
MEDPNSAVSKEKRYFEAVCQLLAENCPQSQWRLFECLLDGTMSLSPWKHGTRPLGRT